MMQIGSKMFKINGLLLMHISKVGTFFKIQEICYQKGTKILKIDLEIAEIIEVKVANFNMEIILLPLCNNKL